MIDVLRPTELHPLLLERDHLPDARGETQVICDDHGRVEGLEVQHHHWVLVELAARLHHQGNDLLNRGISMEKEARMDRNDHWRLIGNFLSRWTDKNITKGVCLLQERGFHSILRSSREHGIEVYAV